MARSALIGRNHAAIVNSKRNLIARNRTFGDILADCFGADILPARRPNVPSFTPDAAPLYMTDREFIVDEEFKSDTPYMYEEYLDQLFWDMDDTRRLTFLVGHVGCGKSTVLDFYLRSYCPNLSPHREKFREKLVIDVDVKGFDSSTDFSRKFYNRAKHRIEERCSEKNFPIGPTISHKAPSNIFEWVDEALRYISNKIRSRNNSDTGLGSIPFKYLVVWIDNLDQTTPEVQKKALTVIRDWLEPAAQLELWRAYVPLWPSTLDRLKNTDLVSLPPHRRVPIGPVESATLFFKRTEGAADRIATTAIPYIEDVSNTQIQKFIHELLKSASIRLLPFIERLCFGDLRRHLSIWEGLLSSKVAFVAWNNYEKRNVSSKKREPFGHYDLIDAMLTGHHRFFNSQVSRIANLLHLVDGPEDARDLLIGMHLLFLFRDRELVYEREIHRDLGLLGYESERTALVIDQFCQLNLCHEITGMAEPRSFEVHLEVVDAYLELCLEPAYLENIAMVTPVDDDTLDDIAESSSMDAAAFTTRVESTFAFLGQVRRDEEWFRNLARFADEESKIKFNNKLSELEFPCIWKLLTMRYRDRLAGLRSSGSLAGITGLTPKWWRSVLEYGIAGKAPQGSETLTPLEQTTSTR